MDLDLAEGTVHTVPTDETEPGNTALHGTNDSGNTVPIEANESVSTLARDDNSPVTTIPHEEREPVITVRHGIGQPGAVHNEETRPATTASHEENDPVTAISVEDHQPAPTVPHEVNEPNTGAPLQDDEPLIFVPDEDTDDDSALGSSTGSNTQTLSSSIWQYREENGRTYHAFKDGQYWGPNDEQAQEHLDIAHHLFTLTFEGQLYLAPIASDVQNVLDIGTGTGLWAIDFADIHPSANVIGTDLSPIQPRWVPPNVKFEIDDCEAEWTYPENHFDYVHIRSLFGCVKDWPALYRQVLRCLKPGGYLEQIEFSSGTNANTGPGGMENLDDWGKEGIAAGKVTGQTFETMYHMYDWIRDAGYADVEEKVFKWPLGPWPRDKKMKELGIWTRAHVDAGLENWCLALLTRQFGWSYEQVMVHVAQARARIWDKSRHRLQEMRVVYGRKAAD